MFISIRNELTTPFLERIGLNAKILMISDTIKGSIKSNITLCCATFLTLLLIKIAIGKPIKKAHTTEIEECIIEDKKFSNLEEKKKFSYENKVKAGSIQNIVLSKTLQTTVKARGITKKTIINMIGILNIKLLLCVIKQPKKITTLRKQGCN
jgi:hypothetical protein